MVYRKKHEAHVEGDEPAAASEPEAMSDGGSVNVTWLGEGEDGPSVNTWRGITFPKGEPVAISHPGMIEKAKTNRFYRVEGHDKA